MNRRKFIVQSGWAASGALLFPSLLQSCKQSDLFEKNDFNGSVLIIGAGISGLYAGELLAKQGIDFRILESKTKWGGRLRSLPQAEGSLKTSEKRHIHGQFSALFDLLKHQQATLLAETKRDRYYFNGTLQSAEEAAQNSFFNDMLQAVANLNAYNGAEATALEYYTSLNLSDNIAHIYNVLAGQIYGTSADRISAIGVRNQHQLWTAGDTSYTLKTTDLEDAISAGMANALLKVQYNSRVASIDYREATILVTDTNGQSYSCDKVLITLPLDVLKSGSIEFLPALNTSKSQAIERIAIDHSHCASFQLDTPLWPAGTTRLIGPGAVQSFEVNDSGFIYAEASGTQADQISAQFGDPLNIITNQLESLLAGVSNHIQESAWHQWPGNRSYDSVASQNHRNNLAQPEQEKIYFAGEATHGGGHHGTLHGAMESALRATLEILQYKTA